MSYIFMGITPEPKLHSDTKKLLKHMYANGITVATLPAFLASTGKLQHEHASTIAAVNNAVAQIRAWVNDSGDPTHHDIVETRRMIDAIAPQPVTVQAAATGSAAPAVQAAATGSAGSATTNMPIILMLAAGVAALFLLKKS